MIVTLQCIGCTKQIVLRVRRDRTPEESYIDEAADAGWRDNGDGWECESCRDHFGDTVKTLCDIADKGKEKA